MQEHEARVGGRHGRARERLEWYTRMARARVEQYRRHSARAELLDTCEGSTNKIARAMSSRRKPSRRA